MNFIKGIAKTRTNFNVISQVADKEVTRYKNQLFIIASTLHWLSLPVISNIYKE
jgi:hypothetical protein